MTDLLQRAEQNIQTRRLLKRGQAILVGVSGGLDSMTLLHALHQLASCHRWRLTVAHFNHQLRDRSSDADEKLVCQTAAAMKLPFVAGRADVREFARKSKLSIEMAARKLRHDFFARTARERKIHVIVLAHHADDQVELFFLRLLRGAGGEGLAGMKWRAPSPVDSKVMLVRPLLDATKAELQEFARENKIRSREDATNASLDLPRNRIRNELLPLLKRRYQPALTKTVLRLMEIVGAEADLAGVAARRWLKKTGRDGPPGRPRTPRPVLRSRATAEGGRGVPTFDRLPIAIQRRVLQMQLSAAGVPVDFDLIEQLRESPDRFVSVNSALSVLRDVRGVVKLQKQLPMEFNADELTVDLAGRAGEITRKTRSGELHEPPISGKIRKSGTRKARPSENFGTVSWEATFGGRKFLWAIKKIKRSASVRHPFSHGSNAAIRRDNRSSHRTEFFDADKIGGKITLRHWRPGDRFQPIGMKSAAKLQDLFTNRKIPRARRRELILATAEKGEIFWVEGLRISENFKLTPQTERCLNLARSADCPQSAASWLCQIAAS